MVNVSPSSDRHDTNSQLDLQLPHPFPVLPPVSQRLSGRFPPDVDAKTADERSAQLGFDVPNERNKTWTDNHFGKRGPHHVTVIRHQLAGLHHKLSESTFRESLFSRLTHRRSGSSCRPMWSTTQRLCSEGRASAPSGAVLSVWRRNRTGGRCEAMAVAWVHGSRISTYDNPVGYRSVSSSLAADEAGAAVARFILTLPGASLTVTSDDVSRRSFHSRATDRPTGAVSPGQSVLTASFATRKSGVQIPPAPLNALVRTNSASSSARQIHDPMI